MINLRRTKLPRGGFRLIQGGLKRSYVFATWVDAMVGDNNAPWVSVPLALKFGTHPEKGRAVLLTFVKCLNVFSLILSDVFLVLLIYGLMFGHLLQAVWSKLVLYSIDRSFTCIHLCIVGVRIAPSFSIDYLFWRVRQLANYLVFSQVDINLTPIGNNDIKGAPCG